MRVVSTSEKEWTASEIMALEWPVMPAKSLKPDSTALPTTLTRDRLRMTVASFNEAVWFWVAIQETSCCGRGIAPAGVMLLCAPHRERWFLRFQWIEKGTCGTYNCPTDAVTSSAAAAAARPHASGGGIACSVCTGDLAPRLGDVMQCKELDYYTPFYADCQEDVRTKKAGRRRQRGGGFGTRGPFVCRNGEKGGRTHK